MTCSCGNKQCYVCSIDVEGYDHFSDAPGGCPLFDDTEERERRDVAVAQRRAVLNALTARNDLTENDLTVDENLVADVQEQREQDEVEEPVREVALEREREEELEEERENEEWEDEERLENEIEVINFQKEWETQGEQEAIAAVREFERTEQLRLEEEARIAAERELQRQQQQAREQMQTEELRQQLLRVQMERQEWEDFVWRCEVLHRSPEEEREATRSLSAAEVEIYWAAKIQKVKMFAEDARQYIAQNEVAFKTGKLDAESRERHLEAKSFLKRAEQELVRFRKEANGRQREAKKRQKAKGLQVTGSGPATRMNKGLSVFWKRTRKGS